MSVKIMSEVWEHASVDGGTLLVLLTLADSADEATRTCYPGIASIAAKARLSERQAQYCLQRLREIGVISVLRNASPLKTNLYKLADVSAWAETRDANIAPHGAKPETQSATARDAAHCVTDAQPIAPKPSVTSVKPSDVRESGSLFGPAEKQMPVVDRQFDEFWAAFPKRSTPSSKKNTKTRFIAALKKVPFPVLLAATKAYAASRQGQDPQFTKGPEPWLNGEFWTATVERPKQDHDFWTGPALN